MSLKVGVTLRLAKSYKSGVSRMVTAASSFDNGGDEVLPVVSVYSLQQAVEDGVLFELRPDTWLKLSGGKPIVVTSALWQSFDEPVLLYLWNQYVHWRKNVMATLAEEDRMFTYEVDGVTVWLIEDGAAFTILRSTDY